LPLPHGPYLRDAFASFCLSVAATIRCRHRSQERASKAQDGRQKIRGAESQGAGTGRIGPPDPVPTPRASLL
jgi:hypothetical protein